MNPASPLTLEVEALSHAYGSHEVVRGLSLLAAARRHRLPARPERLRQDHGAALHRRLRERRSRASIRIDGRQVSGAGATLPPEQRRIGMVFQDYALFPHLTVSGNIAFGLHGAPREARARACRSWPRWSASPPRWRNIPHEISGGQQQRVALARALAPRPDLLLLDEPFSNLDVDLRERLSAEVREIIKASGATAVLVTHDQQEAFAMADEIGVLHDGRIQQWDSAVQPLPPPGEPLRRRLRRPGRVPAGEGAQRAPARDRARRAARRRAARQRQRGSPAAARRRGARRRRADAGRSRAQGVSRRRDPLHAAPGERRARCWRWCRATTTTPSASASASASTSTTSSPSRRKTSAPASLSCRSG